ncbi:helix-turn-helix domain-containing protein, partial [Anaerosacchariphilus polymeriproducens]
SGGIKMLVRSQFKERLKELRFEKNVSMAKVQKDTGISANMISFYERGVSEPTGEKIIKLAQYFRVTSDYLLGLSNRNEV